MLRSPAATVCLAQSVSEKAAEFWAAGASPGRPQSMARKEGSPPLWLSDMPSAHPSLGAGGQSRGRGVCGADAGAQGASGGLA